MHTAGIHLLPRPLGFLLFLLRLWFPVTAFPRFPALRSPAPDPLPPCWLIREARQPSRLFFFLFKGFFFFSFYIGYF